MSHHATWSIDTYTTCDGCRVNNLRGGGTVHDSTRSSAALLWLSHSVVGAPKATPTEIGSETAEGGRRGTIGIPCGITGSSTRS